MHLGTKVCRFSSLLKYGPKLAGLVGKRLGSLSMESNEIVD